MLSEITIENVAVIKKASVVFGPGFNVLTGETGAGKSILIDAINAILGNRTSKDVIRSGAEKATLFANFTSLGTRTLQALAENGYEAEDGMVIQREISLDGKNTCRINGKPAPLSLVKEICADIINIHGQHDNQSLLNPDKHIDILNLFASNNAEFEAYSAVYKQLVAVVRQIKELELDADEKMRKLELLQYQIQEIEMANLQSGELEQLEERKSTIKNLEKVLAALNSAAEVLNGEQEGAANNLAAAKSSLASIADINQELASLSVKAEEAYYSVLELLSLVNTAVAGFDFDKNTIDEIEDRLDLIYKLRKKYGASIDAILSFKDKAAEDLHKIQFADETVQQLKAQRLELLEQAKSAADILTKTRFAAFEELKQRIISSLHFLNMPNIDFSLVHNYTKLSSSGQDQVEFYISANVGEVPKPLSKIASGGELSRIMLAIKNALSDKDRVGTLIYDEIDNGVSGAAAGRIGRMLKDTSNGKQVICVTHTAQIAAYADTHLYIEKEVQQDRTFTSVKTLEEQERVGELARIISGDSVTQVSLENAKEMIESAKQSLIN